MYHPCSGLAVFQPVDDKENDNKDINQPLCRAAAYINLHGACLLQWGR